MGGASLLDAQRLWDPETLGLVWSVSKTISWSLPGSSCTEVLFIFTIFKNLFIQNS